MKWKTYAGKIRPLSESKFAIKWDEDSLSNFQFKIKQFLKPYWQNDKVGEEVLLPDTRLRVDFVNFTRMVAIECNGLFHVQYTPYFQNSIKDFKSQVFRDVYKEHLLEENGFYVVEIYEKNLPLTEKWISQTFGEGFLF
jgi:hypothetical protein